MMKSSRMSPISEMSSMLSTLVTRPRPRRGLRRTPPAMYPRMSGWRMTRATCATRAANTIPRAMSRSRVTSWGMGLGVTRRRA